MCVCFLYVLLVPSTKSSKDMGQNNHREFTASLVASLRAIEQPGRVEKAAPSAASKESRKREGRDQELGAGLGSSSLLFDGAFDQ